LAIGGWLHTEVVCPPEMVTHPSTNRARRRVTLLMRPTPLPLRQTATINGRMRRKIFLYYGGREEKLLKIFSSEREKKNKISAERE